MKMVVWSLSEDGCFLNVAQDLFPLEVVEKKAKKEGAAAQVWKDA